jgi:NAD(P)-dependent dehydrogenase (short-subunit alcohol dehydrogenase family)
MVEAARRANGPVDIVIANAGMAESTPFKKMDLAHWQRSIDVNLTGAFLTVQAALPDLIGAAGEGRRIVFIASIAGLKGYAYVAAYCAAKHGVIGLARALSVELAPSGVTVNAVCPGYTESPMLDMSAANVAAKTGRPVEAARAQLASDNPNGRLITPEEVAQTVLWLCSPAARSVSGQAIEVAGGAA